MTIVTDDYVVCCCVGDCKKAFDTVHGFKVHHGQVHAPQTRECVTCGERFECNQPDNYKQCLDCIQEYGPLPAQWHG